MTGYRISKFKYLCKILKSYLFSFDFLTTGAPYIFEGSYFFAADAADSGLYFDGPAVNRKKGFLVYKSPDIKAKILRNILTLISAEK